MNYGRMIWVGRHEGLLRDVARACAYGDPVAQRQAANILSTFLPDKCCLVPMPSHIGYATTMKTLCRYMETPDRTVLDCLHCTPHESSHIVKLRNGVPPSVTMFLMDGVKLSSGNIFLIDNTIATGATASAALDVIPNSTVLALTKG